jgi:hypothetical protein
VAEAARAANKGAIRDVDDVDEPFTEAAAMEAAAATRAAGATAEVAAAFELLKGDSLLVVPLEISTDAAAVFVAVVTAFAVVVVVFVMAIVRWGFKA